MQRFDDFDEQTEPGVFAAMLKKMSRRSRIAPRQPFFAVGIVGLLTVLLIGVLWFSYPRGGAVEQAEASVPLIRADASPAKVQPDQQGGMDIPSRDSTVFNSLRGKTPDGKVENLLPQAEQPVDHTHMFGLKTASADASSAEAAAAIQPASGTTTPPPGPMMTVPAADSGVMMPEPASTPAPDPASLTHAPAPVSTPAQPQAAAPAPAASPMMTEPSASEPAPAAAEKPATAKHATKITKNKKEAQAAGGSCYAQLASLKDKKAAAATWAKVQKQFPALKGQAYRVQEATVAGSTVYRLQVGPFSADKARSLCGAVTAQKPGACIVVRH